MKPNFWQLKVEKLLHTEDCPKIKYTNKTEQKPQKKPRQQKKKKKDKKNIKYIPQTQKPKTKT
jgi:hypothetical protein